MKVFDDFVTCCNCNHSFDRDEFEKHDCMEMMKPAHNHIWYIEDGKVIGKKDCPDDCPVIQEKN